MKLGLQLGYWQRQPYPNTIELVKEAENLGYDSVWAGEAYGSDVFTPLAFVASHTSKIKFGTSVTQLSARTPTCAAMTAMTMDHLTQGRFIMGIGVSGPQVVEGWYGVPFGKPLRKTREWLDIFNQVIAREAPVSYQGMHYQLPYDGDDPLSWGLGKPLKSITVPYRPKIPVYIGAEGPKNVEQTFKIADGWFPIFCSPYRWNIYEDVLSQPRADDFEIVLTGLSLNVNDNLAEALLPTKMSLALYIGGMGAKSRNFHKELISRMGFADEADEIQRLYLGGEKEKAVHAVPDVLADEFSLSGPKERIVERIQDWKKTPVTTLTVGRSDNVEKDVKTLRWFAEAVL